MKQIILILVYFLTSFSLNSQRIELVNLSVPHTCFYTTVYAEIPNAVRIISHTSTISTNQLLLRSPDITIVKKKHSFLLSTQKQSGFANIYVYDIASRKCIDSVRLRIVPAPFIFRIYKPTQYWSQAYKNLTKISLRSRDPACFDNADEYFVKSYNLCLLRDDSVVFSIRLSGKDTIPKNIIEKLHNIDAAGDKLVAREIIIQRKKYRKQKITVKEFLFMTIQSSTVFVKHKSLGMEQFEK